MREMMALTAELLEDTAQLVAAFRVELSGYKGVVSKPDVAAGREELLEYQAAGYPVYAAVEDGVAVGYVVCRIDEPCVWVESLFVKPANRRSGVASALFAKAEEIAASYGEEMVYNYVHPNNDAMIAFLQKRGYSVLNLLEIRKPYAGEKLTEKIKVRHNEFDY